jgi:hypothetical protein
MLYPELLTSELRKQRDDFQRYAVEQSGDLRFYLDALRRLEQNDFAELRNRLARLENIGARPADELGGQNSFTFQFGESWNNHEQARAWASEILQNRTTFAADGSQIYAEKDTSLPVGAIQIGWFENPHDASQRYEKNAYFEILSPRVLLENQDDPMNPETRVGEKRFHAEIEKISASAANVCRSRFSTTRCLFRFRCRRPICRKVFCGLRLISFACRAIRACRWSDMLTGVFHAI